MKRVILVVGLLLILLSCHRGERAVIKGHFYGAPNRMIFLEKLSPSRSYIVDSTRTNSDGKFKFIIDMRKEENPVFYNVHLDDQFVPLLVERGEAIKLSAIGHIYNNYTVTGSVGSEKLYEFISQSVKSTMKMDSIQNLYNKTQDAERRVELGRESVRQYIKLKQATINFIMRNATSLVSVVPLYQTAYSGILVFDDPTDIIYYRAIADSLGKIYPTSPHVISLRNDIERIDQQVVLDSILTAKMRVENFPNISMKDARGVIHRLDSLKGKTILLSFTSSEKTELKMLNRELMDLYSKYQPLGFEIFEVSVESNRAQWLRTISDNRLPWIQVCDFLGNLSPAVTSYNVTTLPSYFLIDSSGEIIHSHMEHDSVKEAVDQIMK